MEPKIKLADYADLLNQPWAYAEWQKALAEPNLKPVFSRERYDTVLEIAPDESKPYWLGRMYVYGWVEG